MAAGNFKVIVVGGGPVGLTAALALEKAGIDFVLLERRSHVVIDAGSNLVMSPIGMRALYQLGLRQSLEAVSTPLGEIERVDHNGREMGKMQWFIESNKLFGAYPRVISRHDLTKVLHDGLSAEAQAKLLPSKKLSSIVTVADGVVATCADGSSYTGSMIIGADGAHSMVRDLMVKMQLDTVSTETASESPFLTTYRSLWARFPRPSEVAPGTTCETHGSKAATQFFAGEESAVLAIYEQMDEPTHERVRYTQADQEALISRWGHLPVTPGATRTLAEVYASRQEAGLVSLEEGVVKDWSHAGCIVLAGDAAHKFTPSTGSGCNNGIIDIVVLTNELRTLVDRTPAPENAALASAFKAYQDLRFSVVEAEWQGASNATASATWQTGVHKFIDRHVISHGAVQRFLFSRGAPTTARTPAFNFVSGTEQIVGRVPWATPVSRAEVSAY